MHGRLQVADNGKVDGCQLHGTHTQARALAYGPRVRAPMCRATALLRIIGGFLLPAAGIGLL